MSLRAQSFAFDEPVVLMAMTRATSERLQEANVRLEDVSELKVDRDPAWQGLMFHLAVSADGQTGTVSLTEAQAHYWRRAKGPDLGLVGQGVAATMRSTLAELDLRLPQADQEGRCWSREDAMRYCPELDWAEPAANARRRPKM